MRLLDLFACSGGAGEGYRRAGFTVTGVDKVNRPYPCGQLVKGDVLDLIADVEWLRSFDAIHASPPCQTNSRTKHLRDAQGKQPGALSADLLVPVREALAASGRPYVIENVEGADMRRDLVLCGSMFDLHVHDDTGKRWLKRHRVFESNVMLMPPGPCDHKGAGVRPLGVYGSKSDNIPKGGQTCVSTEQARDLMGMPWASWKALTEAIPPAYTQWIGGFLAASVANDEGRWADIPLDGPGDRVAGATVDGHEAVREGRQQREGELQGQAEDRDRDDVVAVVEGHRPTVRIATGPSTPDVASSRDSSGRSA